MFDGESLSLDARAVVLACSSLGLAREIGTIAADPVAPDDGGALPTEPNR